MKSVGWVANSMPMVFWSASVEEWGATSPRLADGMEAEVTLPNKQIVVVDEVRYQGLNAGRHHWQGRLSMSGKASAQHTWFNCVACGTDTCQLPKTKSVEGYSHTPASAYPARYIEPQKPVETIHDQVTRVTGIPAND